MCKNSKWQRVHRNVALNELNRGQEIKICFADKERIISEETCADIFKDDIQFTLFELINGRWYFREKY